MTAIKWSQLLTEHYEKVMEAAREACDKACGFSEGGPTAVVVLDRDGNARVEERFGLQCAADVYEGRAIEALSFQPFDCTQGENWRDWFPHEAGLPTKIVEDFLAWAKDTGEDLELLDGFALQRWNAEIGEKFMEEYRQNYLKEYATEFDIEPAMERAIEEAQLNEVIEKQRMVELESARAELARDEERFES